MSRHAAPEAKLVEVIHVKYCHGEGVEGSPVRIVDALFTKDGKLICRHDSFSESEIDGLNPICTDAIGDLR